MVCVCAWVCVWVCVWGCVWECVCGCVSAHLEVQSLRTLLDFSFELAGFRPDALGQMCTLERVPDLGSLVGE